MSKDYRAEGIFPVGVQSNCFDGTPPEARFAVAISNHLGSKAVGGIILPAEDAAAVELVQETYRRSGIIGSKQDVAGLDINSERYVVLERSARIGELSQVFATCKLVHHVDGQDHLPIEKEFPGIISDDERPECVEISQVVSRHPDKGVQELGFFALLRAAYGYAISSDPLPEHLRESYEIRRVEDEISDFLGRSASDSAGAPKVSRILCMTEGWVIDHVEAQGLTAKLMCDTPILLPEARDKPTELFAVGFEIEKIRKLHGSGKNEALDLFLNKIDRHLGLGLFDSTMLEHLGDAPVYL